MKVIIDGIIGFSIGDALGVPAEFKSREELKRYPIIGAIVGGLLGIYYGIDSIKDSWKKALKRYDYIVDLCGKFEKIGGNN